MVYENLWEWEGKTKQSATTSGRSLTWPTDPFPFEDVKRACEIAIISETTAKFQEEMAKLGIMATVTKIEPEVWIETTESCRQFREWTECTWQHWLHMKAKVYFITDKPIIKSPIDPLTLAALVKVVEYLIAVIAAALVIYAIAKTFIESFFVETHVIRTHDPATCQWTEEIITKPKWETAAWLIVGIVAVIGTIIAVPKLIEAWKKKGEKS